MAAGVRQSLFRAANAVLSPFELEIWKPLADPRNYISFRKTIAGAKAAGISVGDYIEQTFDIPGQSRKTIDIMAEMGAFTGSIGRIVEIGPGSGRYLEKTLEKCRPAAYEIYETAPQWRQWLIDRYSVISQPTDGYTLRHTESDSAGLVHAHKVFPILPVFSAFSYLREMARVTRPGGRVVFDALSEDCLDPGTLEKWLENPITFAVGMLPKDMLIRFCRSHGLVMSGSFLISMRPGLTQYFVFEKKAP